MKYEKYTKILAIIFITIISSLVGSLFTIDTIGGWYTNLNKSIITPPNWIFGPAWTILYILMAISAIIIWLDKTNHKHQKIAILSYVVQLFFNSLWSIVFFYFQNISLAIFEMIILLILIVYTSKKFFDINKIAGYLMLPYILWVSFALVLNISIFLVN